MKQSIATSCSIIYCLDIVYGIVFLIKCLVRYTFSLSYLLFKGQKKGKEEKKKERINRSNVTDIYILQRYDSINQEAANTGKKRNKYSFFNFALVILILMTGVTTPRRFGILPLFDDLW